MKKILLLLVFSFSLFTLCEAQYIDLLSFNSTNGLTPNGSLTLSITRDTLYGLTVEGGAYNYGNIFCIKRDGASYADLLDFNGSNGAYPYGSLTLSKSGKELYGLTSYGGNSSFGDIFTIHTDGSSFTDIFDFNGTEGAYPTGSLTASVTGDSLFGMTGYGGYGYGNIFYISPNGSNFSDMYDFSGSDGSEPFGSLTLVPNGKSLMGMTYNGGNSSYGSIFIISNSGSVFSSLYSFTDGLDGAFPYGDLVFSVTSDSVFGLCSGGGNSGYGSLFTISAGDGLTDLVDFGGAIGATPEGDVKVVGSTLYGMTSAGGAGGNGTVFSYRTNNNRYEDLLDFMGTIGSKPYGSLVYANKVLYGMTSQGGEFNYGIIFGDTVLTVSSISLVNVTCTSGNIGVADAIPVGGVTPYTYSWNPGGSTNESIGGLSLGSYTVTVADNRGSIATSVARITGITASASVNKNVSCYGADDGEAIASISGGSAPFYYSWSDGGTNALATGLSAGTYTVTVSDMCDATATASATITQPLPVPTPTIVALTLDSLGFRVASPVDTLAYSWTLVDVTGTYSGLGDTAYLPVWPRHATFTFYAEDPESCTAQASISITHNISLPSWQKPYPRWSQRGMYLENVQNIIDTTYIVTYTNQVTPVVNYCRDNHITYVLMDGLEAGATGWVFGFATKWINPPDAGYLAAFIDSLKTRGGVKQVGVVCYNSQTHPMPMDSLMSYSVTDFDNGGNNAYTYNYGLPWQEKIDVLSLDDEFWIPGVDVTYGYPSWYANSLSWFHSIHMTMLRAMYDAAHQCPDHYLRVEDYVSPPLDINNYVPPSAGQDSVLYTNTTNSMIIDSICLYADRILFSSYTYYSNVLWNRGDWMQGDSEIGLNRFKSYYKKEVWPVFSAENYSHSACIEAAYGTNDYSGAELCDSNKIDTADWIENIYYDSLKFSEKYQIWTDDNYNYVHTSPMDSDTCFQMLGCMWFDYNAMKTEGIKFDTNTRGPHKGYLPFYITLPHDSQYIRTGDLRQPNIRVSATVHGGVSPFTYIWYNIENGKLLKVGFSPNNSYNVPWTYGAGIDSYNVAQLGVVVTDANDSTVTDYMNIYEYCDHPDYPHSLHHTPIDSAVKPAREADIYPNPNNGMFTLVLHNVVALAKLEIYSVLGTKVFTEDLPQDENNYPVNLSDEPDGIYFYRVISEQEKFIGEGKIIIEK